jgi:hypothetical protein
MGEKKKPPQVTFYFRDFSAHTSSKLENWSERGGLCCPWLKAEMKVSTILGIFFHLWAPPLFKTPEVVVVGFQKFWGKK